MIVGISWYRREDYDLLMSMFLDRENLDDTFDDWHSQALEVSAKLTREGLVVEKAFIDPATFPEWCRANGLKMDAKGRVQYANEWAAKKAKLDSKSPET
jgi:hypothetical protein